MSALRAVGAIMICLAVGSLLALVAASRMGGIILSQPGGRARCRVSGSQVLLIASSDEFEVREVRTGGIRVFVGAHVPRRVAVLPPPQNYTTPPQTVRLEYVSGEILLVDAKKGRALGLPGAALFGDPAGLAKRAEELAAAGSQLRLSGAPGDPYLGREVAVPSPGRWYAVVVAVGKPDSPIPANASVDCNVFFELRARLYPGPGPVLRSACMAAAGILLILLDRVRSGREDWSRPVTAESGRAGHSLVPSSRWARAQQAA